MTLSTLLPYGHHGIFIAGAFGASALLLALELALLARRCRATRRRPDPEAGQ
ncbi:heme exporter protein CcmD [Cupriavidus taiwanensis]|uniref:heme exporter protein CcmD n=1 Tax=Cupriavidus taiwanensis TaxID=164546 RepID=UPI000E10D39A|nr:heme exporter protein CcmD [Cupriavidus taiwanensis]SOY72685.1 Heme exporter protein D cytochrome c-type biogenesis protein CcmD [Cupriavidus taiwanensis]SOY72878.1 Heme exporter protein D cytochrome c-type biogenesis protein CcmD [Cupriavidus taiwanensis]SOY96829.1 Heme exporter protein D cytochrome c-type biogenesis protein CcmD [Cupriavidus taiwanensis]SOZ30799.1 Heme exporter protein D cytochrome c-type biogenesis protein CcmD [Cupriavidus taiwanensis]SOZ66752.1 Heme exporter protein D 